MKLGYRTYDMQMAVEWDQNETSIMFAHETARETQFLHLINIHMSVQVHYTICVSALRPRKTFKSNSGWLTYPSHIIPVQAFRI